MKNTNLIEDEIRRAYIDKYLECSKKVDYKDLNESDDLQIVLYKDLPNTEVNGYPVASDFVDEEGKAYSFLEYSVLSEEKKKKCELRFFYLPNYHEIYAGTSGSGKTTGCCEPQLRAISSQKNKPNLFITDPKGELYERNIKHLKKQGYKTFILNFKNPLRSDKWNPLKELYDLKMQAVNVGEDGEELTGEVKEGLFKMSPLDGYGDVYYRYKNFAFPNPTAALEYIDLERVTLETEIESMASQIAKTMVVVTSKNDQSWELGGQNALFGMLLCLLELAGDKNSGFTKDMMTLKTLQDFYIPLREFFSRDDSNPKFSNYGPTKIMPQRILSFMQTAFENAPTTRRSYMGCLQTQLQKWFQAHILALTTGCTIDLDTYDDTEHPFAVFLVTRDYDKSDFAIAGLFVDWVYRVFIKKAEANEDGMNKRPLHFLLDEFGNIPEIRDFQCKVATARSRNIWFHLVVQSYKQIELVYDTLGTGASTIIRDNCNSQIFLGAQNYATKEIFSRECGKHSVPTLNSWLRDDDYSLTEVPLVPISELDLIKPGEMYVKRVYKPVFTSRFVRSYEAASAGIFKDFSGGLKDELPYCTEAYTAKRYTFKFDKYKSTINHSNYF